MLSQLISKIQRVDERRQRVREALLAAAPGQGGNYDAELLGLNREIEETARKIHATLKNHAGTGTKPDPVKLGAVIDPELKAFLEQVGRTVNHLRQDGGGDPAALQRDKQEAERLKRQIEQRKRELGEQERKTKQRIEEVKREQSKLKGEERKLSEQRRRFAEQRRKIDGEEERAKRQLGGSNPEAEKKRLVAELERTRDSRRRAELEQKIQRLNHLLQHQDQRQKQLDQVLQRYQKLRESLAREEEHLEEASEQLEDRRKGLDEELKALDERLKSIAEARKTEDGNLNELSSAKQKLEGAAR